MWDSGGTVEAVCTRCLTGAMGRIHHEVATNSHLPGNEHTPAQSAVCVFGSLQGQHHRRTFEEIQTCWSRIIFTKRSGRQCKRLQESDSEWCAYRVRWPQRHRSSCTAASTLREFFRPLRMNNSRAGCFAIHRKELDEFDRVHEEI